MMKTHDNNVSVPNEPKFNALINEQIHGLDKLDSFDPKPAQQINKLSKAVTRSSLKQHQASSMVGGCISAQTLYLDTESVRIHDAPQYQAVLKELGSLYKAFSEDLFQDISANLHTPVEIKSYDSMVFSAETVESITVTNNVSDDELEEFAYLSWLSN